MATTADGGKSKRLQEIKKEIKKHRAQIKRSQESLAKMDQDTLADAGVTEGGRITKAQEAIKRLEDERRSLEQA